MDYNILEAKIEYTNGKLSQVIVLVEISKGDVRAIFASRQDGPGYMHIKEGDKLSDELLQQIAGYGRQIMFADKLFPKWKSKYKKS